MSKRFRKSIAKILGALVALGSSVGKSDAAYAFIKTELDSKGKSEVLMPNTNGSDYTVGDFLSLGSEGTDPWTEWELDLEATQLGQYGRKKYVWSKQGKQTNTSSYDDTRLFFICGPGKKLYLALPWKELKPHLAGLDTKKHGMFDLKTYAGSIKNKKPTVYQTITQAYPEMFPENAHGGTGDGEATGTADPSPTSNENSLVKWVKNHGTTMIVSGVVLVVVGVPTGVAIYKLTQNPDGTDNVEEVNENDLDQILNNKS